MPNVTKEDAVTFPNWRLMLDEITSIKEQLTSRHVLDEITSIKEKMDELTRQQQEKMDELTRGQRQIQQSLAAKGNRTSGSSLPPVQRHLSHTSVRSAASADDITGANRMTRRQTTTRRTVPSLADRLRLESGKLTRAPSGAISRTSSEQVNHFVAMAEKELKFVFEENTKTKNKKQEINDYVQQKCKRVSQRYAGDLVSTVSESRYLHKVVKTVHKMSAEKLELLFDSVVGLIIFVNAIFVGISMDSEHADKGVLLVIDIIFGITFWIELLIKLRVHGWRRRYCCGRLDNAPSAAHLMNMPPSRVSCGESFSNCFDLTLVIVDTLQLISILFPAAQETISAGIPASLFRVVRLLRLARILRLLRARVFRDLLSMIQGMMGGFTTLCWSLVLFVLFIYVVALVFRETIGPDPKDQEPACDNTQSEWYFRTVARSMFTVFRCSFGDCSTAGGMPIFETVVEDAATEEMRVFLGLFYSGFVFVVMIGLFNVISAIFVESTMAAAAELAAEKQRNRLDNPKRWAVNFIQLLLTLMKHQWPEDDDFLDALSHGQLTDPILERLQSVEISRELFDQVIETDGKALEALQELDIQSADHRYLSDILDPDNSSTIGVFELIDGLQRLRGDPRRSDIIAVDLMVRSIQLKIDDIWGWTRIAMGNATETAAAPRGEDGSICVDALVAQQL